MSTTKSVETLAPVLDMKVQLEALQSKLEKARKNSEKTIEEYTSLVTQWTERYELSKEMIERSTMEFYHVDDNVRATLAIFFEQAERYKQSYELLVEKEVAYVKEINEKLANVNSNIMQIASLERFSSLDKKLRELTAGTDISDPTRDVIDTTKDAIDSRAIQQIIYSMFYYGIL